MSYSKHTLLLPFSAVTEKPSGNPKDTPDRTIIYVNSMINLWYGKRNGKYVVVKKEVLPLDPESDKPCSDDLSEFDLRI